MSNIKSKEEMNLTELLNYFESRLENETQGAIIANNFNDEENLLLEIDSAFETLKSFISKLENI